MQRITPYCFYQSNIIEFTLPSAVTKLDPYCFCNCRSLTTLIIPPSSQLKTISEYVFCNCTQLSNICLPLTMLQLGNSCFENCYELSNTLTFSDYLNPNNLDPYGKGKLPRSSPKSQPTTPVTLNSYRKIHRYKIR